MPPFACTRHAVTEGYARQQEGQGDVLRTNPRHCGGSCPWAGRPPVSKPRLVDTNLIVRYLVQDHEKHSKAARKLVDACDRGDVVIVVLPAVLAECVFVLESFYEHPRGDISSALGRLISSPGVEIGEATIHPPRTGTLSKNKSPFRALLARRARGGRTDTGGHLRSGLSKVRRRAGRNPVIFLRATGLQSMELP